MPSRGPQLPTDQQRFARAGRFRFTTPAPLASDQAWLRPPSLPNPALPVPRRPVAPKPLVVAESTWVIRGKDGTYLGFSFGDGRKSHETNLYDYLPADRVPHLGNCILSLTGVIPDAIGLDISSSIGAGPLTAIAGINIIWHTRGEGRRTAYPEVHIYSGGSGGLTVGSLFKSFFNSPNVAASVQVILAWATHYDSKGKSTPAPNYWVADGFNWTGTFWSAAASVPLPPRLTLVGSYFRSSFDQRNTTFWHGISVGIGVSGKLSVKSPLVKIDLSSIFSLRTPALSWSQTEYGIIYGNGNDFIPAKKSRPKSSLDGWHMPVNQNDY